MVNRERIAWLISVALLGVLALSVPGTLAQRDDDYKFVRALVDIHRLVSSNFVEPVQDEKLREAAINGMLGSLDDPFTIYVPPAQHEAFEQMLEGSFKGVGIELNQKPDGTIEIVTPIEGSPAFNAGALAGDVLLKVDGKDLVGKRLPEVIKLIKGPLGSEVTLTVRHVGGEVVDLTMKRAEIIVPTLKGYRRAENNAWNWFISDDPKIAYVRLTQFTPDSADKLRDLLTDLLKQGMTGLVFDLRFNPGGRLDEAIKVIDLFIEEGVIVKTKGRNRPEQVARANPEGTLPRFHMVVLVNEHSASASEVVAGSLLDNRRAVIIGERTYGKGSVQEPIPLDGGGDLKLTVAYYYLPSGRLVHRRKDATDWGVEPQIIVKMDETQQRAVLRGQAEAELIRGPASTRPSTRPATQPVVDLQLQRALETLVALDVMSNGARKPVPVLPSKPVDTTAPLVEPTTTPAKPSTPSSTEPSAPTPEGSSTPTPADPSAPSPDGSSAPSPVDSTVPSPGGSSAPSPATAPAAP